MMIRNIKAVVLFAGFALIGCGGTTQSDYQDAKLSPNADGSVHVTDGQKSEDASQVDIGQVQSQVQQTICCESCTCEGGSCSCSGCGPCP